MRENPYAGKDPKELLYAGDNFERYSGQVKHVRIFIVIIQYNTIR